MALSTYLDNALVSAILRATTFTSPANVYFSLHSANPGKTGTSELASSGSYARTADSTTGGFASPSSGVTSNSTTITFPTATGDWNSAAVIPYMGVWDAATTGNFLFGAAVTTPRAVVSGDTARFNIGDVTFTMD